MRYWVRHLFTYGLIGAVIGGSAIAQNEPEFMIKMPAALIDADDDYVRDVSSSFINVYRALENASFGTEMIEEPYNFVFVSKNGLLADSEVDVSQLTYLDAGLKESVQKMAHNESCLVHRSFFTDKNTETLYPIITILTDSSLGQDVNLSCFAVGLSVAIGVDDQKGEAMEDSSNWDERAYAIFSEISQRNHNAK